MKIEFETKYFAKNFIWLEKINSTNDYIKKYIDILKDKTVVATLNQTAGRGTKNRKFISIPNKTLAVSIIIKNVDLLNIEKIPIITSIAVVKTLENLYIKNVKIKWFNDILLENKKVCGILCESFIENKFAKIIIGIGINLYTTKKEFEKNSLLNACSIFSKTKKIIASEIIIKTLIEKLELLYIKLITGNIETNYINFLKTYKKYCCTLEKYIKIFDIKNNIIKTAKAIDISKDGRLICCHNNNIFAVDYNNFSVRD